jgi:hypothetical protein
VGPIRQSSERPTTVDCLRELGRVIQRDHGPTCIAAAQELQAAEKDAADVSTKRAADADEGAASVNATEVLMLNTRLKMIQERAAQANKAALETEKARDETTSAYHRHLRSFLHARASCHVILLFFLVYRGTMPGGRSVVGARHARMCEVEDTDSAPVMQI